ncbi:MAG: glucose-6-phosphate dehydrogenase, partial [Parcubacteria group bacterium]|nr:glucose-6-phosphate dehydrogenase [Parcubacteria group bacterium]
IFGATGDLMTKKIAPALFHLFEKGELPREHFRVVGFSRRDISREQFRALVAEMLSRHEDVAGRETLPEFLNLFSYHKGDLKNENDYRLLNSDLRKTDDEWGLCSNKLFYLAVTPEHYQTVFRHLASSGLALPCSPREGWTRVIVEKPFGKDLETAEKLDELLGKLFQEIQIYRIDHYLAKEMLQNILTFRFSNNLFEQAWNNQFVERIDIRLLEKIGVEGRGSFYDGLGALRDVGQNHLLQMLALVTMEHPEDYEVEAILKKREEILRTLRPPQKTEIEKFTFRAQYEGYRSIPGVAADSQTETYFKTKAWLDSPRWRGVAITLESGKRMLEARKEIEITFKHPTPCLCPPGFRDHLKNRVIFSLEPEEAVTIQFWAKKPGLSFEVESRSIKFFLRETKSKSQYVEEYERLLLDCIRGDQTLFLSTEEMKAMWRFIDPIINAWKENATPLNTYKPDTNEIREKTQN